MSAPPRTLDVSGLPQHAWDTRAQLWWGNTLLLVIETTMFGIVVAAYFYYTQNFNRWPPAHADSPPYLLEPVPRLLVPTINLALMLVSIVPMVWTDLAARRLDRRGVQRWLSVCFALGLVACVLRFYEYQALIWKWDSNAYGSITWTILGLHMLHLVTATLEFFVILTWVLTRPLDPKHALDVTLTAVYWYWVVGVWLVLYGIIFWGPRLVP